MAYPGQLLDHYQHPRHRGRLRHPTHTARLANPLCGDEVTVQLQVAHGIVQAVTYEGVGCAISLGAADLVAAACIRAASDDVRAWDEAWLHGRIGMVPPEGRRGCARLGLLAVQGALVDNHPPQGK